MLGARAVALDPPEAGVTSSCKLPDVGAGN